MHVDGKYCPTIPCRWSSYGMYRLLVLTFLMNETSLIFGAAQIAHSAFFIHGMIHIITMIFMGIPLVYSEICIAQYSNCNLISMWNFFPLFRGLGYGMIFAVVLRTMYLNCLTSWYLVYTFYSALDSPPWTNCDFFEDIVVDKCMVKKINVSTFQYCLKKAEADINVPYYTASYVFFEHLIGGNNTSERPRSCFIKWETLVAVLSINFAIFILAIKKHRFLQFGVKLGVIYVGIAILVLFCVALLEEGSWELTKMDFLWNDYNEMRVFDAIKKAFLTTGSGTGMIAFLSRDVPFRSPATMTAIVTSLFGATVCLSFSLILFSGIKVMVFYHGGEERVLEEGHSIIFTELASVSEVLSYFESQSLWTFFWFSAVFYSIVIFATIFELMTYRDYNFRKLFSPSQGWGPRDTVLFKSRNMFVPSLMTSEFMYRQVRIRGYRAKKVYSQKTQEIHEDYESIEFDS
ncbi:sodium:neurotransmitter symporter family domain-containing protein [Phthorimaea operculella]|nr:sodium:neurotransmitter symporter family domain-containing protein [Phthorimaea operculella]